MDSWIKSNVSAILLAAGLSSRMGGRDKLLLTYGGKTLLEHAVKLMDSLPFHEKILVTVPERLEHITLPSDIKTVINRNPDDGLGSSLRLGVEAASGGYYFFLPSDQPLLTAAELLRLLHAAKENEDKIIYPVVNGEPRNPSLFPARFRAELLSRSGDSGGRAVRMAHPLDCVAVEEENPEAFFDIDTEADYIRLTGM